MSGSRGVPIGRGRGENRFYNPPHVRKQQQQQQQQQLLQRQQLEEKRKVRERDSGKEKLEVEPHRLKSTAEVPALYDKRTESGESESPSIASSVQLSEPTNLDRFLEYTTPVVPAQYMPKTSLRGWRNNDVEFQPYFVLDDLWESFKEWSAYGAGVPLLLDENESVKQYYVPYLSGIQLYVDPSKPSQKTGRPGEESDAESSRETSSDGSSDCGVERRVNAYIQGTWSQQNILDANIQSINRLSLKDKPFMGSSSDESETCGSRGQLIFEYFEHDPPFSREPLADKISILASRFPELKTYRSSDLLHSSWMSVAWYPIYRIPTGPTLQNLDACFLTFHLLSTSIQGTNSDAHHFSNFTLREFHNSEMPSKLPLPTFGLASYKFKVSFWNCTGVQECQKSNSLLRAADIWLKLLQVNHPDYRFFVSHSTYVR